MKFKQAVQSVTRKAILDVASTLIKPATGIHILNGHTICKGGITPLAKVYFRNLLKELNQNVRYTKIEEAVSLIQAKQLSKSR
jgi:hypothetical protein